MPFHSHVILEKCLACSAVWSIALTIILDINHFWYSIYVRLKLKLGSLADPVLLEGTVYDHKLEI